MLSFTVLPSSFWPKGAIINFTGKGTAHYLNFLKNHLQNLYECPLPSWPIFFSDHSKSKIFHYLMSYLLLYNAKGPSMNVNVFTNAQTIHLFRPNPPPFKSEWTNILPFWQKSTCVMKNA